MVALQYSETCTLIFTRKGLLMSMRHPLPTGIVHQPETLESRVLLSAPPQVAEIFADNRARVEILVTQDLAPATVNGNTVQLYASGPDAKFGTADDVPLNATIGYDALNRIITAQTNLPINTPIRIHLDADVITNTNGVHLDGEFVTPTGRSGDGTPGGDFDAVTRIPDTQIVRFWTDAGRINVRLFDDTPLTKANFLQYVNSGAYDGTFIHRSLPGFVVQGGGFFAIGPQAVDEVPALPPVQNEPVHSNIRGTIAMAKLGGDPDSATNQWFFNLADNSDNLDNQNGGFTAFGEITDAAGLAVMDALATFPIIDAGGVFADMPVQPGTSLDSINLHTDAVDIERVALLQDVVPTNPWRIGAVADFNGDGHADILWRNYRSGDNVLWYMNNGTRVASTSIQGLANPAWELIGAADLDADGDKDLIWRNRTTGANTIWLMNNRIVGAFKALPPVVNLNWKLAGIGDFNADGQADLLWRHFETGNNSLWLMNGAVVDEFKAIPPVVDLNYRIGSVAELNGDGLADVVFRHSITGKNIAWLMNGNQISAFHALPGRADTQWSLVGGGQFDNQAGSDLLWANASTRAVEAWGLFNMTYTGTTTLPSIPV